MYTYIHIHIYIHTYILHIYIHIYIHIYTHIHTYVRTHDILFQVYNANNGIFDTEPPLSARDGDSLNAIVQLQLDQSKNNIQDTRQLYSSIAEMSAIKRIIRTYKKLHQQLTFSLFQIITDYNIPVQQDSHSLPNIPPFYLEWPLE